MSKPKHGWRATTFTQHDERILTSIPPHQWFTRSEILDRVGPFWRRLDYRLVRLVNLHKLTYEYRGDTKVYRRITINAFSAATGAVLGRYDFANIEFAKQFMMRDVHDREPEELTDAEVVYKFDPDTPNMAIGYVNGWQHANFIKQFSNIWVPHVETS